MAKTRRTARSKRVRRSQPAAIHWPGADQKVSLAHALIAVAFGNASILARYLRETTPPLGES